MKFAIINQPDFKAVMCRWGGVSISKPWDGYGPSTFVMSLGKHIGFRIHYTGWKARKEQLRRFFRRLNPFPVYYIVDSTDCDQVRVVSAHRAPNGWSFERACDELYYWAEGPTHIHVCTKETYEMHETTRRDYITEEYEDGHPHVIYR